MSGDDTHSGVSIDHTSVTSRLEAVVACCLPLCMIVIEMVASQPLRFLVTSLYTSPQRLTDDVAYQAEDRPAAFHLPSVLPLGIWPAQSDWRHSAVLWYITLEIRYPIYFRL